MSETGAAPAASSPSESLEHSPRVNDGICSKFPTLSRAHFLVDDIKEQVQLLEQDCKIVSFQLLQTSKNKEPVLTSLPLLSRTSLPTTPVRRRIEAERQRLMELEASEREQRELELKRIASESLVNLDNICLNTVGSSPKFDPLPVSRNNNGDVINRLSGNVISPKDARKVFERHAFHPKFIRSPPPYQQVYSHSSKNIGSVWDYGRAKQIDPCLKRNVNDMSVKTHIINVDKSDTPVHIRRADVSMDRAIRHVTQSFGGTGVAHDPVASIFNRSCVEFETKEVSSLSHVRFIRLMKTLGILSPAMTTNSSNNSYSTTNDSNVQLSQASFNCIYFQATGGRSRMVLEEFKVALEEVAHRWCDKIDYGRPETETGSCVVYEEGQRRQRRLRRFECLKRFLKIKILPHELKSCDLDMSYEALFTERVIELLQQHKLILKMIFTEYMALDVTNVVLRHVGELDRRRAETSIRNRDCSISVTEFEKFAMDFNIVPRFLSVLQLAQIFRNVNWGVSSDAQTDQLDFTEFVECIVRCAWIGFEHDHFSDNSPLRTPEARVHEILMTISSSSLLRMIFHKHALTTSNLDDIVGAKLKHRETRQQESALFHARSLREAGQAAEAVLSDNNMIHVIRRLFDYYAMYGASQILEELKPSKFQKLLFDADIIDEYVSYEKIDLLYLTSTTVGARIANKIEKYGGSSGPYRVSVQRKFYMTFSQFMKALEDIAKLKYAYDHDAHINDKLEWLLMEHLYPLFETKIGGKYDNDYVANQNILCAFVPEDRKIEEINYFINILPVKEYLIRMDRVLRLIFHTYAVGDWAASTNISAASRIALLSSESGLDQIRQSISMSSKEFRSFTRDFCLCPTFLTQRQVLRIFIIGNDSIDEDARTLSFREFLICLCRIGFSIDLNCWKKLGVDKPYSRHCALSRLEILFGYMDRSPGMLNVLKSNSLVSSNWFRLDIHPDEKDLESDDEVDKEEFQEVLMDKAILESVTNEMLLLPHCSVSHPAHVFKS